MFQVKIINVGHRPSSITRSSTSKNLQELAGSTTVQLAPKLPWQKVSLSRGYHSCSELRSSVELQVVQVLPRGQRAGCIWPKDIGVVPGDTMGH